MAQVLVSMDEEHQKKLRRLAHELKGGKKGAISEVVMEALDDFERLAKQRHALKKLQEISKQAKKLGIGKFNREEVYADIYR